MQYSEHYEMNKPEPADFYDVENFNQNTDFIDQKIKELSDAKEALSEALAELKKYVSDGKSAVASAVTEMGVSMEPDAAFEDIANAVLAIAPTIWAKDDKVFANINGKNEDGITMKHGVLNTPGLSWNGAKLTAKASVKTAGYVDDDIASNSTTLTTKEALTITPSTATQTAVSSGSRMYFSGALTVASLGGNAVAAQVLSGYTFSSDNAGRAKNGSMANHGAVSQTLNCGYSYTIPAGYHNGGGRVVANSLSSQTSATATAARILSGYTAWINGNKVTGTFSVTNGTFIWGWGNQLIIPINLRVTGYTYGQYASAQNWVNVYNSGSSISISQGPGYADITSAAIGYYYILRYSSGISLSAGTYRIAFRVIHYSGSGGSGSSAARFYIGLSTYTSSWNGGEGASSYNIVNSGAITNNANSSYYNYYYDFTLSSVQTVYPMLSLVHKQKVSICAISIWKIS